MSQPLAALPPERVKKLPRMSLRGAKRRGNLVQAVTNSPKTAQKSQQFCEIATAYGLAMTNMEALHNKVALPELSGRAIALLDVRMIVYVVNAVAVIALAF